MYKRAIKVGPIPINPYITTIDIVDKITIVIRNLTY